MSIPTFYLLCIKEAFVEKICANKFIVFIFGFIFSHNAFADCYSQYHISNIYTEFDKFKKRIESEMDSFVNNYVSNHYIDTLCYNDIELNKLKKTLNQEVAGFADFYCLEKKGIKKYDPTCDGNLNTQSDDYYKNVRAYEKQGFLISCDDTLNAKEREIDPRPHGGFDNMCNSGHFFYLMLNDKLVHKREKTSIHTNIDNGTKTIRKFINCERYCEKYCDTLEEENVTIYDKKGDEKWISCGGFIEILETKYDSSGSLIFSSQEIRKNREILSSRIEVWSKGKLVKTKYNNINRSIVEKTPCYLKVLEPNETIILQLDPEKEPPILTQEKIIDSAEVYEVIKYHWYPHCKKYYEAKKLAEANLNQEKGFDTSMKDSDISPSHTSSYKYYAIIAVCIAVASIAIIRKRRKAGK